jgi:hypothetical protein
VAMARATAGFVSEVQELCDRLRWFTGRWSHWLNIGKNAQTCTSTSLPIQGSMGVEDLQVT